MKQRKMLQTGLGIALMLAIAVSLVYAQQAPQGGPGGQRGQMGGQRGQMQGGRGGFDRAAMQERMMNMMQERMGASDEEWAVIEPRLSKVMELSRDANGGGGMMRGMMGRGRRGQQGPAAEDDSSEVQKAAAELQETLEKEAPTAAEIKAKLTALRGAREKNKQELVKAQQQLREVLTLKQEAQLVMMGMLD